MLTAVIIGRCRRCRGVMVREPVAVCYTCRVGHWHGQHNLDRLEATLAYAIAIGCGRCLHVDELIEWLWGDDASGGPDDADTTVRCAVWRLRREHHADWIENEHGYGWRLNMSAPHIPLRSGRTRHSPAMTVEAVERTEAVA